MNVSMRGKMMLAVLALGTALSAATPGLSQEKLTITLDTPPGHVRNVWIGKFADALKAKSDGAIEVEVFDSGQLFSSRDAGKAVARGDAGMAIVSTPALARIEANLNVLDLPMFNGMGMTDKNAIVDGPLGQKLSSMTAEKMGVVVPGGWYILGALNTYSTDKVVKTFGDLDGLKVRIPGAASWIAAYKEFAATPVNMPFTDVPLALQQGAVDAIVSSNVSIRSAKLNESGLKHAFVNNLGIGYYMPIVSQKFWSSLSADQQAMFTETWNQFVEGQRAAADADQAAARTALEAAGMDFSEPSEADLPTANTKLMSLQAKLAEDLGISAEVLDLAKQVVQ